MRSTIKYLFSLQKFGMKFGLRNIRSLLHSCGDPQKQFRSIHVAGTNGKGSTSSMIAAILTAAGYKVGLYTSPHLVKFNERIRINGSMISDAGLERYTKSLRPSIDKNVATFFEAATAIAFKYFADQKVDIAVIETGLGGRLDSTNVIRPVVSVITSIGKDHTEQLGSSIESIALEKAGIIKPRVPVIIGNMPQAAQKIVFRAARKNRSAVIVSRKISLRKIDTIELKGKYQRSNARCAVAAVTMASKKFLVGDVAIREGLERTSELSGLRARLEMINTRPRMILDVAHNPDGMKNLVNELASMNVKMTVVFGVMKDKDYHSMLEHLRKLHCSIIVTKPVGTRALPSEELYRISRQLGLNSICSRNVKEALKLARTETGKSGIVVVTGSHYLAGEVMNLLKL